MTDTELDELREATEQTDRAHQEPVSDGFEDELLDALNTRLESGAQRSVSIWNGEIAALLDALENNPDRAQRIAERAEEKHGIKVADDADRSELVRMLFVAGLASTDPELMESWREAIGEHARQV